jgi:hypothetical protein
MNLAKEMSVVSWLTILTIVASSSGSGEKQINEWDKRFVDMIISLIMEFFLIRVLLKRYRSRKYQFEKWWREDGRLMVIQAR